VIGPPVLVHILAQWIVVIDQLNVKMVSCAYSGFMMLRIENSVLMQIIFNHLVDLCMMVSTPETKVFGQCQYLPLSPLPMQKKLRTMDGSTKPRLTLLHMMLGLLIKWMTVPTTQQPSTPRLTSRSHLLA